MRLERKKKMKTPLRNAGFGLCVVGLVLAASGCGSEDKHKSGAASPTAQPTATATVTPTPNENIFGSTQVGSGALTVNARPEVEVFLSACLGGSGPDCTGGTAVYIGTEPGFEEAEEDEPVVPLYTLVDDTPITVQVTAIDPAVSLHFDDVTLSAAGQSVSIGMTPGIHKDLEWYLQIPGGSASSADHSVTVKLTTTSSRYTESDEFTLILRPTAGEPE